GGSEKRIPKGETWLTFEDALPFAEGLVAIAPASDVLDPAFEQRLKRWRAAWPDRLYLGARLLHRGDDRARLAAMAQMAQRTGAPMVATNGVLYHHFERRPLQDVLTCIREGTTIDAAGLRLQANAERYLKPAREMARLFQGHEAALARTAEIVQACPFSLDELKYRYPDEPVPPGKTADQHLRRLAIEGARRRWPKGAPAKIVQTLRKELKLIRRLKYPHYFLTVNDIVAWARGEGILCQGRGSAANSVVCYCLEITGVDPTQQDLLIERFISEERAEPPDIDVDFEHERREEVMQYVYRRYGRHRAAIVATVIHYRPRMAIRQVGKALGLTEDITAALANTVWGAYGEGVPDAHIRQAGLDPDAPEIRRATSLAHQLLGFPRHLSQHVGGFVLTQRRLDETVPIGNAAMDERTFIEWDKDDIDALGLMKVDVLALGMLTALKKAIDLLPPLPDGRRITDIAEIPQDDPTVYEMLCHADSVGVFQVESRAQMSMLPRLKPREFYDLVIEVAIVRPGPIQGDMVHPYLKRREGKEPVVFPSPAPGQGDADELRQVLGKTLGVPLFQEQAMRLAIEAARFTEDEADGLRRSMATFRANGRLWEYREKFIEGMTARGYEPEFAQRCFKQIEGFGSYGFPESHAISFALLVYASAWVKRHHPDVFCASLLNAQPMGFYQPAQLVRDARDHGVEVRPPDILASDWDCTLEEARTSPIRRMGEGDHEVVEGAAGAVRGSLPLHRAAVPLPRDDAGEVRHFRAVRLGFRQIKGFRKDEALRLMQARSDGARTLEDFALGAGVSRRGLELLAEAEAVRSLGLDRRQALWAVKGLAGEIGAERDAPLIARRTAKEAQVLLPFMGQPQHVAEDYRTTSLSLKAHPASFFREELARSGAVPCAALKTMRDRRRTSVGGLVLVRQRPGTAKGVVFMTLEDETGIANVVVWKATFEANRRLVMGGSFVIVHGQVQKEGEVIHLVAERFTDLSHRLSEMRDGEAEPAPRVRSRVSGRLIRSRDFH
ncbi:MAG TPA: error-prone DNA polymerase, partial [Phenylobacterium sp.]|uniref:error-prone DNA polymerase n=1 Tax=Phenylobacterium sp. TaxID=1871053 RepID=UPI002B8794A8